LLNDINSIFYIGDSCDAKKKQLDQVNDSWKKKDLVICNQCITVGVNYDLADFDLVFAAYSPFVLPRDLVQVSMRIRTLKENKAYMVKLSGYSSKDVAVELNYQL